MTRAERWAAREAVAIAMFESWARHRASMRGGSVVTWVAWPGQNDPELTEAQRDVWRLLAERMGAPKP